MKGLSGRSPSPTGSQRGKTNEVLFSPKWFVSLNLISAILYLLSVTEEQQSRSYIKFQKLMKRSRARVTIEGQCDLLIISLRIKTDKHL